MVGVEYLGSRGAYLLANTTLLAEACANLAKQQAGKEVLPPEGRDEVARVIVDRDFGRNVQRNIITVIRDVLEESKLHGDRDETVVARVQAGEDVVNDLEHQPRLHQSQEVLHEDGEDHHRVQVLRSLAEQDVEELAQGDGERKREELGRRSACCSCVATRRREAHEMEEHNAVPHRRLYTNNNSLGLLVAVV